jgi:hypothetical protein
MTAVLKQTLITMAVSGVKVSDVLLFYEVYGRRYRFVAMFSLRN